MITLMNMGQLSDVLDHIDISKVSGNTPNFLGERTLRNLKEFLLLYVKGNDIKLSVYASKSFLGKWYRLALYLLRVGGSTLPDANLWLGLKDKLLDDSEDLNPKEKESLSHCLKWILINTFIKEGVEPRERLIYKEFRSRIHKLIELYELLVLPGDQEGKDLLELLTSKRPVDTFIKFCRNRTLCGIYIQGITWGYFQGVNQWEDFLRVVDVIPDRTSLDVIGYKPYKERDLSDEQLRALLERGFEDLLPMGIERNIVPDMYKEYISESLLKKELVGKVESLEDVISKWEELTPEERTYLRTKDDRFGGVVIEELGLYVGNLDIALHKAGLVDSLTTKYS